MKNYNITIAVFFLLIFIGETSNGQSIYKREVDKEDSSISIFTTIDTMGIKENDCKIFGLIVNMDSINFYCIAYQLKAPQIMYLGKTYKMKLFFEEGNMLEYDNINDEVLFDKGAEIEFRTIVKDKELNKMKSSTLCMMRLERPGYYKDIAIEKDYKHTLSNLAQLMLATDAYKD